MFQRVDLQRGADRLQERQAGDDAHGDARLARAGQQQPHRGLADERVPGDAVDERRARRARPPRAPAAPRRSAGRWRRRSSRARRDSRSSRSRRCAGRCSAVGWVVVRSQRVDVAASRSRASSVTWAQAPGPRPTTMIGLGMIGAVPLLRGAARGRRPAWGGQSAGRACSTGRTTSPGLRGRQPRSPDPRRPPSACSGPPP